MMKCTLVLLLTTAIHYTDQHGRMFEPPARNTMWRMGFETHANYEDSELFCGGISVRQFPPPPPNRQDCEFRPNYRDNGMKTMASVESAAIPTA